MSHSKLIVNASNCHQGGGKTLIHGFLKGASKPIKTIVFIDDRLEIDFPISDSIDIIRTNKFNRFLVGFKIKKLANEDDKILYFGNLPPFLKFKCNNVLLQLSSRFYVDSINMRGFSLKDIIKIYLEKFYFKLFIKNVTQVIVQTSTMYNLLKDSGFKNKISIWGFDDLYGDSQKNNEIINKEKNTFIYVASLLPYKNHQRLLKSWKKLKQDNINPKLYLTIEGNGFSKKSLKKFVEYHNLNVIFLEDITREKLLSIFLRVETLIYPSLFEAYGLPLIEAKKHNMKIIASDLDYCWDFIEPDEFFNPYDVDSIVRAVKRFLKKEKNLDTIYSPQEFFNKILNA